MTRKEKMGLLLSKVAEEQKPALIAELREAETKAAVAEILRKFGITLTDEEKAAMKESDSNEVSDEELDLAAGGCCSCHVNSGCPCGT